MANKLKIIHASDLHLGYPFPYLSMKKGDTRRAELRQAFTQIIEISKNEGVPLLLWAGNLFHTEPYITDNLFNFVCDGFSSIPEVKILLIPGDCDRGLPHSFHINRDWPKNVHVFQGDWELLSLPELDTDIYGLGNQPQPDVEYNPFANLQIKNPEATNILLLQVPQSSGNTDNSNSSLHALDLQLTGATYIALGNNYARQVYQVGNRIIGSYPGSPEPLHFNQKEAHGINLVTFDIQGAHIKFLPLSQRHHYEETVDITGLNDLDKIADRIKELIPEAKRKQNMFRLFLEGTVDSNLIVDKESLIKQLSEDFFFLALEDNSVPDYNIENIAQNHTVQAIFVERMQELIKQEQDPRRRKIMKKAFYYGLDAFIKGKVNLR